MSTIARELKSNTAFQTHSMSCLMLMVGLIVSQSMASSGIIHQHHTMTRTELTRANEKSKTFQELGFFGAIKEDQWEDFVLAVQTNIARSRKEPGNLAFSLYQPEDGKRQPIWFEQFQDKQAHTYHKEQDYFKNAITVIQKSVAGQPHAIELNEVDEVPAMVPRHSAQPGRTRHVIGLYTVKPEKRQSFIAAMAPVMEQSRQAQGNLEYNFYQYVNDANKFVLIEGWQRVADQEVYAQQAYSQRLRAIMENFLIPHPMDTRESFRDISQ